MEESTADQTAILEEEVPSTTAAENLNTKANATEADDSAKPENISMESTGHDTSLDSSGKKTTRKKTIDRGLDGNYWGQIAAIASTSSKRKRKTVERLYVGDISLIGDDEGTKDNDDDIKSVNEGKEEEEEVKERSRERQKSSDRKIFYKQKSFIAVRNESSKQNFLFSTQLD